MIAHSSLNHLDENIVRHLSLFLNQSDKIALTTSAPFYRKAVEGLLPTGEKYVTTVKPNLMSAFSSDNGAYSTPLETFELNKYGVFGNFYQSLITHVGANEDRDYYPAWLEHQLRLGRGAARERRGSIDLYIRDLPSKDEKLLVERLRESVDTTLCDHSCLQYTQDIVSAIASNTSIVSVLAYCEATCCRCNLFSALAARSTDITRLDVVGGICFDSTDIIADYCVRSLKKLSMTTADSSSEMDGFSVNVICEAVANFGILEVLDIGNVAGGEGEPWADGLLFALHTCPIMSLRINETAFDEECLQGMVRVMPLLQAHDVKITNCDFGDWGKPVFDALFSNASICWLDVSFTKIGDESIDSLVEMVKRGTLTKLAIGSCGLGRKAVNKVLRATTYVDSKLSFISIFDNDVQHPSVFDGMEHTSLKGIHMGEFCDIAPLDGKVLDVDTRDCDECFYNGGAWPWKTKSHTWCGLCED